MNLYTFPRCAFRGHPFDCRNLGRDIASDSGFSRSPRCAAHRKFLRRHVVAGRALRIPTSSHGLSFLIAGRAAAVSTKMRKIVSAILNLALTLHPLHHAPASMTQLSPAPVTGTASRTHRARPAAQRLAVNARSFFALIGPAGSATAALGALSTPRRFAVKVAPWPRARFLSLDGSFDAARCERWHTH